MPRNNPHSEKTKRKISVALIGRKLRDIHKANISRAKTGKPSSKKGKVGVSLSKETKEKISQRLKGKIPWNKGIKLPSYIKLKMSKTHTGMTLSEETKGKISEANKGSNNGNWNGGTTSEKQKIKNTEAYKIWRTDVFKRDDYSCRYCGKKSNGDIEAHHIKEFSKFPDLRFDVDNGLTLCKKCHNKVHKKE